jgi:hypothetical protein
MPQPVSARCRFAFFMCLIAIVCGCDKKRITSSEVYSPGKDLVLRVEIDETGAAAVPDVTSAFVFPSKSSKAAGKLIFKGSAMSAFRANWGGTDEIILSYGGGYVSRCDPGPVYLADRSVRIVGCK